MVRFNSHTWTSALQQGLDRDAQRSGGTYGWSDISGLAGTSEELATAGRQADERLLFGPYGASPLSGLHFEAADDTAAS
ncbi:MAG TPA: hypothetical protein VER17_03645 [Tepidisphaeraceae bacterium]|nr:hypothetical protein [Tepidisphaeraceae bacterium]